MQTTSSNDEKKDEKVRIKRNEIKVWPQNHLEIKDDSRHIEDKSKVDIK